MAGAGVATTSTDRAAGGMAAFAPDGPDPRYAGSSFHQQAKQAFAQLVEAHDLELARLRGQPPRQDDQDLKAWAYQSQGEQSSNSQLVEQAQLCVLPGPSGSEQFRGSKSADLEAFDDPAPSGEIRESKRGSVMGLTGSLESFFAGKNARLLIQITSAAGLRDADYFIGAGTSDPYCVCQVAGKESEFPLIKTETVNNSLNPVWEHDDTLLNFGVGDTLRFRIYDEDVGKTDDFLGECELPGELIFPSGYSGSLNLTGDEASGSLQVRIVLEEDDTEDFQCLCAESLARWTKCELDTRSKSFLRLENNNNNKSSSNLGAKKANSRMTACAKFCQSLVLQPASRKRLFWDICSLVCIFHDVLTIPFILAFEIEVDSTMFIITSSMAAYWFSDMILNFFTGIPRNGVVDINHMNIVWNYIKGWFFPDLSFVISDWIYIVLYLKTSSDQGSGSSMGRLVKTSRGVRVFRLISILRLTKTQSICESLMGPAYRDMADGLLKLAEAIMFILVAMHFIACSWYALGTGLSSDFGDSTWVADTFVSERSLNYRYSTSLHWAITQCTPASMEVVPINAWERMFTILVDFGGLVVLSTFISTITTRMTQLRAHGNVIAAEKKEMKKYFAQNGVSLHIGLRVMNFANSHDQANKARTNRTHISILQAMPEELQQQLDLEVFRPILSYHPLFKQLLEMNPVPWRELTHSGITDRMLVPKEELFVRKDPATCMFLILSGNFRYRRDARKVDCGPGTWASEATLWIPGFQHRGGMQAIVHGEVVCLDVATFSSVMSKLVASSQPHLKAISSFVAQYVVKFLHVDDSDEEDPALIWSDIWLDEPRIARLVEAVLAKQSLQAKKAAKVTSSTPPR